jgi:hypothetical protein
MARLGGFGHHPQDDVNSPSTASNCSAGSGPRPNVAIGEDDKRTIRYFPDRLPIGSTLKGVACSSTW